MSSDHPLAIRLQVFLSRNGVCSRRRALVLIQDGQVTVNGAIEKEASTLVAPGIDRVCVGKKVIREQTFVYIVLNKPRDCVTTVSDVHAKKTVFDILPKKFAHLHPVGRLDKNTEGLLLLTNDGDLTYRITHPKFNVKKTYHVTVRGRMFPMHKRKLEKGIVLDGKKTASARIEKFRHLNNMTEFFITIHEGRKRQIRLMCEAIGYTVIYLKRIKEGSLSLGELKTGKWRFLTTEEVKRLKGAH